MPKGYLFEKQYGVVIDNTHQPKNGWACISEQVTFYITSFKDLILDVLWLTNIEQELVQKNLFDKSIIKNDGYLRTNLTRIISELALISHSNDKKSSVLSKLFSTVITFLSDGENVGSQIKKIAKIQNKHT
tara:strand:- start:21992 stop:22384 length:393 start_codon:yes stop_codon:yes gene_type:complete